MMGDDDDFFGDEEISPSADHFEFSHDEDYDDSEPGYVEDDDEQEQYLQDVVEALTIQDIMRLSEMMTRQVQEVSENTPDQALVMLMSHRWNVDQCLAELTEMHEAAHKTQIMPSVFGTCCVCFSAVNEDPVNMTCRHFACIDCWMTYIRMSVLERRANLIPCLENGCDIIVPITVINNLMEPKVKETYQNIIAESLVFHSKNMVWCPTPSCETILRARKTYGVITCKRCQNPFCMSCKDDHSPASCKMRVDWHKMLKEEDANLAWILKSTKPCPKCSMPIEKNGGCNWIMCGKCKFEYCWLCNRHIKHSEIDAAGGSHRCNVYKEGEQPTTTTTAGSALSKSATSTSKTAMDATKYLHFYERWSMHMASARLERNLHARLRDSMKLSASGSGAFLELMTNALSILAVARKTLAYSFALAFFQDWDPSTRAKEIFEDLQHLLEERTEALAKCIENNVQALSSSDESGRQVLIQRVDAVKVNRRNLIDACSHGLS